MKILEAIDKKREKQELTYEELDAVFTGYLKKEVPDYQMSSLLMAICLNGLSDEEMLALTDIFIKSGKVLDLSIINKTVVDKHSTGGVGDKTTLIIGPIIASCNIHMAKMSGRGLGLTGGTIDKLESIPGFNVNLDLRDFINQVKVVGYANIAQSDELVPLDKAIYALRDVSGTSQSTDLIAISIMSKKIACGADIILLDIKYGNGALLKNKEEALELERIAKLIGKKYNKQVICQLDSMNIPLGNNIGNALEIQEVIEILNGKPGYLTDLSLKLSSKLIAAAKNISKEEAYQEAKYAISSKKAYQKFLEFVIAQGGDINKLKISNKVLQIKSNEEGILTNINAHKLALLGSKIGIFRSNKGEKLDHSVGIKLNKNINDYVKKDDILAYLYVSDENINFKKEELECFVIESRD